MADPRGRAADAMGDGIANDGITIVVNGEHRSVPTGSTAAELIESLGLAGRPMAVELNETVVPRARLADSRLRDGDRIEIVTLVGGG